MKCPACGYHNLPGAETCGLCGKGRRLVAETAPSADSGQELAAIYPPRARDRSAAMRVGEQLFRPARRAQEVLARPWARTKAAAGVWPGRRSVREAAAPWLVACASVLPGIGQWLTGRRKAGAAHLAAALAVMLAAVGLFRNPASNSALPLLLLVSGYSVWDASIHAFPRAAGPSPAHLLRSLRLALLSASVVLFAVAGGLALLNTRYQIWGVSVARLGPFLAADQLLVQRLDDPLTRLRRGDVVITSAGTGVAGIERVIGLPGDRIECLRGVLSVNHRSLPADRLPLNWQLPAGPFTATVPTGSVAFFAPGGGYGASGLIMVGGPAISGRVVAIYQPPERRCWVR